MNQLPIAIICAMLILTTIKTNAQEDSTGIIERLGLKLHHGFVIIHSKDLRSIRNSYPTGIEIDWAWQRTHEKAWESCHCYPRIGVSLSYWYFDNPDILGSGVTSLFYLEPVFGARRNVSFSLRAAFGLSYQNRPYHEQNNPDNLSYSTRFAFPLRIGVTSHIRLHPQWQMDVGAMYNHISNGGFRQPNKGINWPTASMGVGYFLAPPKFKNRIKKNWREEQDPQKRFEVILFMAFKDWVQNNDHKFSPGIEVRYSRQISRISAATASAEWLHDNGAQQGIEDAGLSKRPHKAGVALGHEFLLGDFIFSQQFGFYVMKPFDDGNSFYQRYGLINRISEKLSFGIALKAHGHVADFLDVRLGYTL